MTPAAPGSSRTLEIPRQWQSIARIKQAAGISQDGSDVGIDWRVLLFALTVSLASGIAFGLLPAFRASRANLSASLKSGGDHAGSGLRHQRARAVLVISEVALASMLLVGAACRSAGSILDSTLAAF